MVVKFVIATAIDATDEAAEIKKTIQIFERVLFCIVLITEHEILLSSTRNITTLAFCYSLG